MATAGYKMDKRGDQMNVGILGAPVGGIDGETAGQTALYTVPSGATFCVVTRVIVRCTQKSGTIVDYGTFTIGQNGAANDISEGDLTDLDTAGEYRFFPQRLMTNILSKPVMAAGGATISFAMDQLYNITGGTITLEVTLIGYLIGQSGARGGYQLLEAGVAEEEHILSITTGINLKATGNTTCYTVPTGKVAIITDRILRLTEASGITVAGILNFPYQYSGTTIPTTTTTALMFDDDQDSESVQEAYASEGTVVFNVQTGYTATGNVTGEVTLIGFLI